MNFVFANLGQTGGVENSRDVCYSNKIKPLWIVLSISGQMHCPSEVSVQKFSISLNPINPCPPWTSPGMGYYRVICPTLVP